MQGFSYRVDGFVLSGWATVQKGALKSSNQGGNLMIGSFLMGLFGAAFPPLLVIAGLVFIAGLIMSMDLLFTGIQQSDYLSRFSIDFNQSPPAWQSDDETFWKPVKDFFFTRGR
jgi:hypothetical protein